MSAKSPDRKAKRPEPIQVPYGNSYDVESYAKLPRNRFGLTPATATTPSVAIFGSDHFRQLISTPSYINCFESPRTPVFKLPTSARSKHFSIPDRDKGEDEQAASSSSNATAPYVIRINPSNLSMHDFGTGDQIICDNVALVFDSSLTEGVKIDASPTLATDPTQLEMVPSSLSPHMFSNTTSFGGSEVYTFGTEMMVSNPTTSPSHQWAPLANTMASSPDGNVSMASQSTYASSPPSQCHGTHSHNEPGTQHLITAPHHYGIDLSEPHEDVLTETSVQLRQHKIVFADEKEKEAVVSSLKNHDSIVYRLIQRPDVWLKVSRCKKGVYRCNHCSLQFSKLLYFAKHMDQLGLARTFMCDQEDCPWEIIGFTKRSEWSRHTKHQHSAQGNKFVCKWNNCQKSFSRKDSMKRHYLLVHENTHSRRNKKLNLIVEKDQQRQERHDQSDEDVS